MERSTKGSNSVLKGLPFVCQLRIFDRIFLLGCVGVRVYFVAFSCSSSREIRIYLTRAVRMKALQPRYLTGMVLLTLARREKRWLFQPES
jgi:hypothetical protein